MARFAGKWFRGIVIGLLAGAVALGLWELGWIESWEAPTWTWRVKYFAHRETFSPKIKLILIDQASLDWVEEQADDWVGGWPWPREFYERMVTFCTRAGARALAIDLIFSEPSVYGVDDDKLFADALESGIPSVLAVVPGGNVEKWPVFAPYPMTSVPQTISHPSTTMVFPVDEILSYVDSLGHVKGDYDDDGVYRRVAPYSRFDGADIPTLGLAAWLVHEGGRARVHYSSNLLQIGDRRIPLDKNGLATLRFRGDTGIPDWVSAAEVIHSEEMIRIGEEPSLALEDFNDCYVFVGSSAPGIMDLRPIPNNPKCPGVVMHATFLDNLLTNSFIAHVSRVTVVIGVLLSAVGAAVTLSFGGRWWQATTLFLFWLLLPLLVGFIAYHSSWWWPIVAQEFAIAIALVGAVAANYSIEGRQKAFIKQAFKRYLSEDVIEKILVDPGQLQLGGEKRVLTMMFTDLEGFSSFSESLEPVELTALLNDYLSEMTDIIMAEGGTLDKYEGDAIIAFWNAPLVQDDHALRACRAATRCQQRLIECRQMYKERYGATLTMRIGINTGEVVVGNMGSRKRFNYSILGDAANLAARLEGANKAFGTHTMISNATWRQVHKDFQTRKLADLRVVGRKRAVGVYELAGLATDPTPKGWDAFAKGVKLFTAGEFADAANVFEQLREDPAAKAYVKRCQRLLSQAPKAWDGVWILTEK